MERDQVDTQPQRRCRHGEEYLGDSPFRQWDPRHRRDDHTADAHGLCLLYYLNHTMSAAAGEGILGWLNTAITTRERKATEAADEPGGDWYYDDGFVLARREDDMVATGSQDFLERQQGEHIALNDPASVLRRCAADRRLIAEHGPYGATDFGCKGCGLDGHEELITGYYEDCPVLCALAEGYGWTGGDQ